MTPPQPTKRIPKKSTTPPVPTDPAVIDDLLGEQPDGSQGTAMETNEQEEEALLGTQKSDENGQLEPSGGRSEPTPTPQPTANGGEHLLSRVFATYGSEGFELRAIQEGTASAAAQAAGLNALEELVMRARDAEKTLDDVHGLTKAAIAGPACARSATIVSDSSWRVELAASLERMLKTALDKMTTELRASIVETASEMMKNGLPRTQWSRTRESPSTSSQDSKRTMKGGFKPYIGRGAKGKSQKRSDSPVDFTRPTPRPVAPKLSEAARPFNLFSMPLPSRVEKPAQRKSTSETHSSQGIKSKPFRCSLCMTNSHHTMACLVYPDLDSKSARLEELDICSRCMQTHEGPCSERWIRCQVCRQPHPTWLCPNFDVSQ